MKVSENTHNEKLSSEKELAVCRAMMEMSGDIAFEWDFVSDILYLSEKWEERFPGPSVHRQFIDTIGSLPIFHPEDVSSVLSELDSIRQGAVYGETAIRISESSGNYTWNRIRAAAEYDEDGRLVKIIGTIADIDSDKRKSQALRVKAEHDSLTGLLNKDTANLRAEQYLAKMGEHQCAAMLLIDLDNFKAVNDLYGHMFGDTVLSHVGSTIAGLFRDSDIMARIGGDEFMVLMRDIPDRALVEQRCIRLTKAMKQLYGRQLQQCQFSCSVGVALAPEHGSTYERLFQRADKALYQAKGMGKNTYSFFSQGTETKTDEKSAPRAELDAEIAYSWSEAAMYMLEQLYENQSIAASFGALLEMIGVELQTEHIFVADTRKDKIVMEWVHPHIYPEDSAFIGSERHGFAKALSLLETVASYCCHDTGLVGEEQREALACFDAKAVMLCAVQHQGEVCGYVGMRSAFESKYWTQKEMDALGFVARMASVFLLGDALKN